MSQHAQTIERARNGEPFSGVKIISAVCFLDVLCIVCAYIASYISANSVEPYPAQVWRITDAIFSVTMLYLMLAVGVYRLNLLDNLLAQVTRILVNSMVIVTIEWATLEILDLQFVFTWPASGPLNLISIGVLGICAVRVVTHSWLIGSARKGEITRNIAIVGAGPHGRRLLDALEKSRAPWTNFIGIYDDRTADRLDGEESETASSELKGTVADLVSYARDNRVDEILVALPWGAENRLLDVLEQLKSIPANVRLAPDVIAFHFLDQGFAHLDGVPVYNVFRKPISDWAAILKRTEDLILGGLIMIPALPVMAVCALAIRLDSKGPILFKQNRYGYNNKLIGVYKFRSMYHEMRDESASKLTTKGDPRITRVGAFLRSTSLDELPQLFNVILGQMSLVGPRPHATQAKAGDRLYQEVVREYAVRHKVKPGITGWAQVNGWRGETDTEDKILHRVECDLYYMEHWTLLLDLEILLRTFLVVAGKDVF
ncbi:MAG TPA: undecaprenyl-phosphate glucose phosphotransferase [Candidatus Sulfotelmatobacter sp.]|jgi:Undecaprenyl-phosphate glucose phosphotransferase|nr:undecaprenyl-phosphate glucose phosphotransferase [Candidatus Sulfotelmatobacter sp.]